MLLLMNVDPYLAQIDSSWLPLITKALGAIDSDYLNQLFESRDWLPGPEKMFNAFSIPLTKTQFILFGESPYPRAASANGYAFWDAAVHEIWSDQGLTKTVNRATSLRNFIKMLLVAEGLLTPKTVGQANILALDKSHLISTIDELFNQLLKNDFCLLNASLVLRKQQLNQDAKAWLPFISVLLQQLQNLNVKVTLILFGNIARTLCNLPSARYFHQVIAEHPYNLSFISNPVVLEFFQPFHLLLKD